MPIPIDRLDAEGRYAAEAAHELTAERLFERRWATSLLDHAVGRLEAEMAAGGKAALFARLLPTLTGGRGQADNSYATIASELGMTPGAVKMAASRLRQCYGEILRQEIARRWPTPPSSKTRSALSSRLSRDERPHDFFCDLRRGFPF